MTDRRPWAAPWGWIAKCPAAGGGAAETAAPQALSGESLEEQSPLQELIQRHGGLMLELARRRAGPAAEDLVQQTLLWMAERQKDWAGLEEARLAAYLAAALGGQWAEMRRQRRKELSWLAPPPEGRELADPGPSLEEAALRRLDYQALARVWPRLPEEDRLALEAKYILQLDDREIARRLGVKPASVRMRLTRARRRALKEMEKEGSVP